MQQQQQQVARCGNECVTSLDEAQEQLPLVQDAVGQLEQQDRLQEALKVNDARCHKPRVKFLSQISFCIESQHLGDCVVTTMTAGAATSTSHSMRQDMFKLPGSAGFVTLLALAPSACNLMILHTISNMCHVDSIVVLRVASMQHTRTATSSGA